MKSEKVQICGSGFRYEALIGRGLMARAGELVRPFASGPAVAVIADENSARLFADTACHSLRDANYRPTLLTVTHREKSKSLAQVELLCRQMIDAGLDRSSLVVGLGGGVIGDLSGFVAAIFHRGIPHLQLPTTLLAMVDSAIGGKTGVNLPEGKNLLGAIHHPVLVLADTDALTTLPRAELRQGFAEIIKHGIIRDREMLASLALSSGAEQRESAESRRSYLQGSVADCTRDHEELIARNIRIKAEIVAADERETSGARALLNFGHTVGHAIEGAGDFQIPHGDCVSLGMVAACNVSIKRAGLAARERDEVIALLKRFELPTRLPLGISHEKIIGAVRRDKKFVGGDIRFIVTPRLGEARVARDVTIKDIHDAITQF